MLESQKAVSLAFTKKNITFFKYHKPWVSKEIQAFIEKTLPNTSAGFSSVVNQI
tara:strand:+ start:2864 stop:3025 length:162 start_codon:yes stop_codon:yes gene_type:complete